MASERRVQPGCVAEGAPTPPPSPRLASPTLSDTTWITAAAIDGLFTGGRHAQARRRSAVPFGSCGTYGNFAVFGTVYVCSACLRGEGIFTVFRLFPNVIPGSHALRKDCMTWF